MSARPRRAAADVPLPRRPGDQAHPPLLLQPDDAPSRPTSERWRRGDLGPQGGAASRRSTARRSTGSRPPARAARRCCATPRAPRRADLEPLVYVYDRGPMIADPRARRSRPSSSSSAAPAAAGRTSSPTCSTATPAFTACRSSAAFTATRRGSPTWSWAAPSPRTSSQAARLLVAPGADRRPRLREGEVAGARARAGSAACTRSSRRERFDAAADRFEATTPSDLLGASRNALLRPAAAARRRGRQAGAGRDELLHDRRRRRARADLPRGPVRALGPRRARLGVVEGLAAPEAASPDRRQSPGSSSGPTACARPSEGVRGLDRGRSRPAAGDQPRRARLERPRGRLRRAARVPRGRRRAGDARVLRHRDERRRRPPRALAQGPRRGRAGARSSRLYEATLDRLEAEGYHCAPVLRRSYERERALAGLIDRLRVRILFTTSNGTGLGHLTRSMAIARRLGDEVEPLFLTLSAAAPVVERMGFRGRVRRLVRDPGLGQRLPLVAPPARPAAGGDRRGRPRRDRLRRHPPLRGAARGAARPTATAVWCRRPLWKRGLEPGAARPRRRLRRRARAGRARRVRGRAARRSRCATAPTGSARSCSSTARELLPRAEAEAELGLEPGRHERARHARPGGRGARGDARAACARSPAATGSRWRRSRSALAAAGEVPDGVVELQRHLPDEPLLRRLRRRGRRRRLQRLPRADRARRAVAVRADAPRHRRPGRPAPATRSGAGSGSGSRARATRRSRRSSSGCSTPSGAGRSPTRLAELAGGRPAPPRRPRWLAGLAGAGPARRGAPPGAIRRRSDRRRAGLGRAFRRRWGTFFASLPRTAVRLTRQQLTQPRARAAGARARRSPTATSSTAVERGARRRRGGAAADAGGHRRARGARRAARARGRGRARAGRADRGRPSSPAAPTSDFARRRLELIRAERPSPAGSWWRREGLRYPEGRRWRPPHPSSRLIKRRRARSARRPHARRGAAEPGRDRGAEVRHQRPALLPRPASRGLDVEAEGAQLLHRGAQLAARGRLVQGALRRRRPGSAARRRPTTRPSRSTRASPSAWHSVVPDAKLIYMIRDPLERIAAHWVHNYAKRREKGTLAETLVHPNTSYVTRSSTRCSSSASSTTIPKERILVFQQSELRHQRMETLRRVFEFVGVDPDFKHPRFEQERHQTSGKTRATRLAVRLEKLGRSRRGRMLPVELLARARRPAAAAARDQAPRRARRAAARDARGAARRRRAPARADRARLLQLEDLGRLSAREPQVRRPQRAMPRAAKQSTSTPAAPGRCSACA